jgi:ATP/ADP translocase
MITESQLFACSTCANNFIHADTNAAGWSIALMVLIIVPMASVILFFLIRMARREGASLDPQYNDDYIPPSS